MFDFDPARTLIIFDDFANNLRTDTATGGTPASREENIRRLLNFFPVIAEDEEGKMVELDARKVLSMPRSIKSQDVFGGKADALPDLVAHDVAHPVVKEVQSGHVFIGDLQREAII